MRKLFIFILAVFMVIGMFLPLSVRAQEETSTPSATPEIVVKPDITQKTPETLGPLEEILAKQVLGPVWPANPIKYAIRGAVKAGVPANTIILLLLLPIVAFVIAVARNVIGIRGFGIFLPASLSVVFIAIGPLVGIGLFLVIVVVSTSVRIILRRLRIKLQYLPRMALILWAVALGVLAVLFMAPVVNFPQLSNVSIFAVLILVLLAEDFIRVQLGKSAKTAIGITSETLILSLISYLFLTLMPLQKYVLLNPEITLLAVGLSDFILAKYSGLRLREIWRFRKLIKS
ncbi:MAG: 7TM domain-containing protein [bacterium]|nr:7TM domain-containing protein [bacterium]